jgi:enoyl-CoA hydratase/carnithine racemase
VIRAEGKDFSIGGARQMLSGLAAPSLTFEQRNKFMLDFYQRWLSILDIPVPTIAAIQGECIGIAPVLARSLSKRMRTPIPMDIPELEHDREQS